VTHFDDLNYRALFEAIADVRTHRDVFLSSVKNGELSAAEIFARAQVDPVVNSMKVLPAVESLPEAGKVQTRRAFAELGIDEAALISEVPAEAAGALPLALERHSL
jgi:hypothetical protein